MNRRSAESAGSIGAAGFATASIAVGAAVATSLVALDGWLGRRRWPSTQMEFVGQPGNHNKAMVTFSGLGSTGGAEQADAIAKVFPFPGFHWVYSNDTFNTPSMAAALKRQLPGLERMGVNGHSMGGPVGLEVARLGAPRGATLGPIALHCSPFDYKDGRNYKAARALTAVRFPTGPVSKIAFTLLRGALEGTSPVKVWPDAVANATTGCSPRLWMQQIRTLQGVDLASHTEEYKRLVGEDTRVWYCRPANPEMDRTVDTVQASERFGEFFGRLGVPFEVVDVPDVGHADVTRGCAQLALRAA
jgi:pimeloyl-ACP methyl ester carboxylesterase